MWFRKDLRLADHPALHEAIQEQLKILPVFIQDSASETPWAPGAASNAWLHRSLLALDNDLHKLGSRLIFREGDSLQSLRQLVSETGATHVYWNRRYEPGIMQRDAAIKESLKEQGIQVRSFNGSLLAEPWQIQNQAGNPFQVFTPYWRHHRLKILVTSPLPTPSPAVFCKQFDALPSRLLDDLKLTPSIHWDRGFWQRFTPGESGAHHALKRFVNQGILLQYGTGRDRPDQHQTSRLSPHLHFGEISPRQILHAIKEAGVETAHDASIFLSEVGWREFAYHLIYHFPDTTHSPLKSKFESFPWNPSRNHLDAWKHGHTGIPIVDAGMRELWHTGWMHNRVRMIVASFLVKNLLIPWQEGARWFWDTLVDADLASNAMGWQWVAGCGADAAPYFRIFNPVLQSQKFDPRGDYIRTWIPELQAVTSPLVHTPWKDASLIRTTGYPEKRISLIESRNRALEAYNSLQTQEAKS